MNLHFDGINSKKISFSNYITHQTAYLMLALWNIYSDMFLLKPAQAEKNECLTAGLVIYSKLQMTWKHPILKIRENSRALSISRAITRTRAGY